MNKILTIPQMPTVDTSAYAAGDLVGTKMTFDFSGLRNESGCIIIDRVLVSDLAKQGADLDLVLFNADLATNISEMDNAAFDPSDADLANIEAVIPITTDSAFSDNGVSFASDLQIGVHFGANAASQILYGVLVSRGTPTYALGSLVVNLTARAG